MRIRKVFDNNNVHSLTPPPPPPPLSDQSKSPPPWLQIFQHSSDPIIISGINDSLCSNQNPVTTPVQQQSEDEKCSSICTKTSATSSVSSSLSFNGGGGWCEEEKVFPLKKRKLSLEKFITDQESGENSKNKKIKKQKAASAVFKTKIRHDKKDQFKEFDDEVDQLINRRRNNNDGFGWKCRNHINQSRFRDAKPHAKSGDDKKDDFGVGKKRKRIRRISTIYLTNPTMP